ncbi:substrate-binding periplasmic protein [Pseudodesulfovibrio portus]|nr:transporter substrate-binding domain-containing protein [Pseudodesulfovibrio portus]
MKNIRTRILRFTVALLTAIALSGPPVMADRGVSLVCDIWPPYQFKTEDGVTGMAVEIVEAVYRRMDIVHVELRAFPWKRALDAIRYAEADALISANHTPAREIYLRYPEEPIFESSWVIWTKAGSSILTLDDLKGKTVGVVLGYSYTPEFWNFITANCTVEKVYNDDINFRKLSEGRLDATVAEFGNGLTLVRDLGDTAIRPVNGIEIKRDGLYIVFNRQVTGEAFVQRFSDELKAFKQTDEHQAIREKYLGKGN